jgi:hypothetical protein
MVDLSVLRQVQYLELCGCETINSILNETEMIE